MRLRPGQRGGPRPVRRTGATRAAPVVRASRGERGVAMLLVLVGLVVLGLAANEVRYNSMVELKLAANARDDLRAHYLAKSGIGLSRLMLRFQKQMDQIQIPNLGGMLQQFLPLLTGQAPTAAAAAPATQAPQTMSIQLWRMAKIDCHMLQLMIPEEDPKAGGLGPVSRSKKFAFDDENPELAQAQQRRKFGEFEGCFDTVITDEEERINLNKLDATQLTAQVILGQLTTTLTDKKYEFLFEKEDSNRVKVNPQDVIIALHDWVDEDEVATQLNYTGQGEPFLKGFTDENGNYARYEPRYKAKNARFDSLDELYLVHGANDRFMAAFKDKFTVYPDINSKMNINTDDPVLLELAIRTVIDPARPDPRLQDPVFVDTLIKKIRAARVFALFGMSALDFVNIIAANGVAVNPTIINNVQNQRFIGDKSSTYRVQVTGTAGDVARTITTVIRLDDGLGRLVYWREE